MSRGFVAVTSTLYAVYSESVAVLPSSEICTDNLHTEKYSELYQS